MKVKKILLIALLCMCFMFIACGQKENIEINNEQSAEVSEPNKPSSVVDEKEEEKNTVGDPITVETVRAHKPANAEEFEIEESETAVRIKGYIGSDEIVVVPEMINEKPVTGINGYTFGNTSQVRGIMLPKTIKAISFLSINNQVLEVVIGEGVEDLGENCFLNNPKLHTVVLGEAIKNLGISPFAGCSGLKELYVPSAEASCESWMIPELFYFSPEVTVYGIAGSSMEEYAKQNNVKFVAQ